MSRYDSSTIAAIHEALDDEYKARATYAAVIERHGAVRPFVNIIAAEDRHARALERLLTKDGHAIPADRWAGKVTAPDRLEQAYALGVQAEIENRDMYDRLERMTREPDVLRVFGNLRTASQQNHLPAFQRHLEQSDGGMGRKDTVSDTSRGSGRGSCDSQGHGQNPGRHIGGGHGHGMGAGGGRGMGHGWGMEHGRGMGHGQGMMGRKATSPPAR